MARAKPQQRAPARSGPAPRRRAARPASRTTGAGCRGRRGRSAWARWSSAPHARAARPRSAAAASVGRPAPSSGRSRASRPPSAASARRCRRSSGWPGRTDHCAALVCAEAAPARAVATGSPRAWSRAARHRRHRHDRRGRATTRRRLGRRARRAGHDHRVAAKVPCGSGVAGSSPPPRIRPRPGPSATRLTTAADSGDGGRCR